MTDEELVLSSSDSSVLSRRLSCQLHVDDIVFVVVVQQKIEIHREHRLISFISLNFNCRVMKTRHQKFLHLSEMKSSKTIPVSNENILNRNDRQTRRVVYLTEMNLSMQYMSKTNFMVIIKPARLFDLQ